MDAKAVLFTALFYVSLVALFMEAYSSWKKREHPKLEKNVQATVLLSAYVLIVQAFSRTPVTPELVWQRLPLAYFCAIILLLHMNPRPSRRQFVGMTVLVAVTEALTIVLAWHYTSWLQQHPEVIGWAVIAVVFATCAALRKQIRKVHEASALTIWFLTLQASVLLLYASQAAQGLLTPNFYLVVGYGLGAVLRGIVIFYALPKVRFANH